KTHERDELEGMAKVSMTRPRRSEFYRGDFARPRIATLQFSELRAGRGEMDFRPYAFRPRAKHANQRLPHVQAIRIETPEMLMIKNETHSGVLMNPERIGRTEAQIVVL